MTEYVLIRCRVLLGQKVFLPEDFKVIKTEWDDVTNELLMWVLQPFKSRENNE